MNKRLIFTASFLTVFIAYAIRYGYGIILPEMLKSMDITKTEAGVIFSSFFIAYTIASPFCGYISDKYNPRWMLSTFVVALGLGAYFMSRSSTILQATLAFILAGIGAAACWAPIMTLAQKWTSHERRGMTLSFIDIGSALSIIGMAAFIPYIVEKYNWQTNWMILGIVGVIIGIFNFLVIKYPPEPEKKSLKNKASVMTLSELLGNKKFWLLGFGYLFTGAAVAVPFTFLSTYSLQELSFSTGIAASVMIVLGIGAIVSKLIIGPLSDKTGRLKMIFLCGLFIFVGTLGMALHNEITLFISAFVFALGYGAVWAMYAAASSDYFNKESSGTIVGIWTLFTGAGSFVSPILAGWLADGTGTLSWSFGWGGLAGLLSVVLIIPLWNKKLG
jgi:MFS transporter, OFA family, oxalate/formate antiporter